MRCSGVNSDFNFSSFKAWKRSRAFTLLELILSVALTGILATAAFALINGAVQMGAELGDDQRRSLEVQRCLGVFRDTFESLPGNARFELLAEDSGDNTLSELRIHDAPEAFQVGGALLQAPDAVSIISEETEAGALALALRYDSFGESEDSLESRHLFLMAGLVSVEWRFFSQADEDWLTEWQEGQGRPRFIELNLVLAEGNAPLRTVFWLPPVVNPKIMISQSQQSNEGNNGRRGREDRRPEGAGSLDPLDSEQNERSPEASSQNRAPQR